MNNSKPFTTDLPISYTKKFQEACRVEGVSYSQGIVIALDCIESGELELETAHLVGERKKFCFNVTRDVIDQIRRRAAAAQVSQGVYIEFLMQSAILNGFGGPIEVKKAG